MRDGLQHDVITNARILTFSESITTSRFVRMILMLFFGTFYGAYLAANYKYISDELDDYTLTIAGSVGAIFNGGSRLIWGWLLDRYGFRKVYIGLMLL